MALRLSRDVVATAKALGHTGAQLEAGAGRRSGGKFRARCTCGYVCTWRNSEMDALEALAHHLAKVTAVRVIDGVSLPRVAG